MSARAAGRAVRLLPPDTLAATIRRALHSRWTLAWLLGLPCAYGASCEAQQVMANGTTRTASGTINTGTAGVPAGYALYALNGGRIESVSPLTLITGGPTAYAAYATAAGTIQIFSGSTITTTGSLASAIYATGIGSSVTAADTRISTSGSTGRAVHAQSGATVSLTGGSVTTTGAQAPGLFAFLGDASIVANNVVIQTLGSGANGVEANVAGHITLGGGSITTNTASSHGILTIDPNATVDATGTQVLTRGTDAFGVHAQVGRVGLTNTAVTTSNDRSIGVRVDNASNLTMTGGSINTAGVSAFGVLSIAGSTTSLSQVAITTSGTSGIGATSQFGGRLTLAGGSITTTGASGTGLFSVGLLTAPAPPPTTTLHVSPDDPGTQAPGATGASLIASGLTVSTSGASAYGAVVRGASSMQLTDSSVTTTGTGANALFASAYDVGTSLVTVDHSTLASSQAAAIRVSDTSLRVGASRGSSLTGNGTLAEIVNAGTTPGSLELNVDASTVNGAVVTSAGTSAVNLRNASTWNISGSSNVTTVLNSASLIAFAAPVSGNFGVLAAGNYTGAGGSLLLNATLAGDDSPADRLAIFGGQASGDTALTVANAGGEGDLTVDDGILLVYTLNGGTTAVSSFTLAQPVIAGPYEYALFRGSRDGAAPDNWYLRSEYVPPPTPPDPPVPPPPPDPPTPPPDPPPTPPAPPPPPPPDPTPDPPSPVPPPVPNYRVEVSTYAALPAMGVHYGREVIGTLHERVGDERKAPHDDASRFAFDGGWARVIGQSGSYEGRGVTSNQGPHFDFDVAALQGGVDLWHQDRADGARDFVGAYIAHGRIKGDVTHFTGIRAGKDEIEASTLGAYWTHFGASGWYVDGVLQGSWYDASAVSFRAVELDIDGDGFGWGASVEFGYPFATATWLVEPQLQVIYQAVDDENGRDVAAEVSFRDVTSLTARLGVRAARDWTLAPDDHGRARGLGAWLRLNVWREFEDSATTEFSSATRTVPFRAELDGEWVELGAGMNLQLTGVSTLYANLGYQSGFDRRYNAVEASLGLRWNW